MEAIGLPTVDIVILLIIILSTVLGLWRGIIRTLFAVISTILAVVAAFMLTGWVAEHLSFLEAYPILARIVAFVLVFVGVLVAANIPGAIAARLIGAVGMKSLDRGLGLLFGLVRGVVVVLALVWLIMVVPGGKNAMAGMPSYLLPYFMSGIDSVKPWLDKIAVPGREAEKSEASPRSRPTVRGEAKA